MWGSSQITSAVAALNLSESLGQMKEATAAIENTSEYVRSEIERRKAIHDKDVAELVRQEHDGYYQKALDCSLAYDDLALHGERELEKVRGLPFTFMVCDLIGERYSSGLQPSEEQVFSDCRHYSTAIYAQ